MAGEAEKQSQQCRRSHERQVRDAGGGAPGSWRKKEATRLCLHDVSGDRSTSHFGGVLVVAESRLQGVGKETTEAENTILFLQVWEER